MWLLLVAFILLLLLYIVFIKHSFWKNKGVPGPKPLPLVGNIGASIIGLKNASEIYAEIYHQYQDCPFVGIYKLGQPCLLLRDPEIIKNVLIKDFHHFTDNDVHSDKKTDPMLGRNPFVLKGEEWKKTRQFITPNFASGRVKSMFPVAERISKNFVEYLEKHEGSTLDAKDVLIRYTSDVVAICAFGIEGNSFTDPDTKFLNMIRAFAIPGSFDAIKFALFFIAPNFINLKLASKTFDDGLIELTNQTLKYRQENNIKKNDYFDVISNTPSLSLIEMAAHMSVLIVDGSDSSSIVMTLIVYELAKSLESQTKLREEINAVLKKFDGELSYEAIQSMPYLEACINESLRLHPPLTLAKTCVQDYTMTSSGSEFRNLSVTLKKGDSLLIPLLGLQRDPKYFPSPNKYMPERFLDKSVSQKYVYMPFGNGPRMCLGSRFGLMQIKVGIAQLIRNFEITLDPKTIQPLKYDPVFFTLYPKGGVSFRCKKVRHTDDKI